MMRRVLLLFVLLAVVAPAGAQQRALALVGATLIDGSGSAPLANATVVIRGERIAAVGVGIAVPADATVIDARGRWIIPGLIDAHVHFFQSAGLYARPDFIDLRALRPYEREITETRGALAATMARYIASGVTSVLDMGGPMWTFDVRAEAEWRGVAPRVAVAGPLLGTWAPPELSAIRDPPILAITSPAAARAATRRVLARRPNLIKIWFVHPGDEIGRELAWVRATIETAHASGVRVVAHATQLRVARTLVDAGVELFAHSVDDAPLDPGLLAVMRARNVVYITTLIVRGGSRAVLRQEVALSEFERRLGDPAAIASWRDLERLPASVVPDWVHQPSASRAAENLVRVQRAGITIAAGSDAGNIGTLHGPALHRELEAMVQAGLTPLEALVAATRGGAAALGRSADLGTLAPGKLADLVVLEADPLADIRNTRRIVLVIKNGEMFDPQAILRDLGAR
jgi:imidazolonepropionase-like amidohydrolase